jgi:hypothetical protein
MREFYRYGCKKNQNRQYELPIDPHWLCAEI